MRYKTVAVLTAFPLLCAVVPALHAQVTYHHYVAIDLGTLGGPNSAGCIPMCRYLNNQGAATFNSDTAKTDPFGSNPNNVFNDGSLDLGEYRQNGISVPLVSPRPGNNSFPLWISDTGLVAGVAENGKIDQTTTYPETVATLWLFGFPVALGTLGGNASSAAGVNNIGQVVGGAANTTTDPNASAFYNFFVSGSSLWWPVTTETHAFLWQAGAMKDLGTLGGTDSLATAINQGGQVTGVSLLNTAINPDTGLPASHPFLWENGKMQDLGTLGGTMGQPTGINDSGQVIGFSTLAGDQATHPFFWDGQQMIDLNTLGGDNGAAFWMNNAGQVVGRAGLPGGHVFHAFLWQNGKMTDLGTLDGDSCSSAFGVNSQGQVVGDSGTAATCNPGTTQHPFLWQAPGPGVDVTKLFPPLSSGLRPGGACCINDLGEIFTTGSLPNGNHHAILLIPCDENHPDVKGCDYSLFQVLPF
jgi:probable HAF family extracellular repeat protein